MTTEAVFRLNLPRLSVRLLIISASFALRSGSVSADEIGKKGIVGPGKESGSSATPAPGTLQRIVVRSKSISSNGVTGRAVGGGLMEDQNTDRQRSVLTRDYIMKQAAAQNVNQLLRLSPGTVSADTDPFGLDSGDLSVRGLDSTEISYLMEGVPVNDIDNYAAYPSQWMDNENLVRISLQQGSANLDSPQINASGGLISMDFVQPTTAPSGLLDASYGSYDAKRVFTRVNTGLIGNSGIKAWLSVSHISDRHFRGPGDDERDIVSGNIEKDWGAIGRTNLVIDVSQVNPAALYLNPTLSQWNVLGRRANYDAVYSLGDTNYYKFYQNPFQSFFFMLPTSLHPEDTTTLSVEPYLQHFYGVEGAANNVSPNAVGYGDEVVSTSLPGAVNPDGTVTLYSPFRVTETIAGLVTKIEQQVGKQDLVAGYWYAYGDDVEDQPYSTIDASGTPSNSWGDTNLVRLPGGQILEGSNSHIITQINSIFVSDTIHLLSGRLTLDLGFKEDWVSRTGWNSVPTTLYHTSLNVSEPLPTIGLHYQLDQAQQVFVSGATNFAAPQGDNPLFDYYSGGTAYLVANPHQRSEFSITEDLGYRLQNTSGSLSIVLFNYNFTNRQIFTLEDIGGAQVTSSIDGGGQSSQGVDVEIGGRPWHDLRPYVSFEGLHATTDNNLYVGGDLLPTAGKEAVRSPRWTGALGLDYDEGTWFGSVYIKHVDQQFSTFIDDERIPPYTTVSATVGYRLHSFGPVKRPQVQINLINLGNTNYLSGAASITPNARTTKGIYGTTIAGVAPTYYVGSGFAALATVSAGF